MVHLVDIPHKNTNHGVTLHSKVVFAKTNHGNYGYRKKIILRKKKIEMFLSVFSFSFNEDFPPEKIYQIKNT